MSEDDKRDFWREHLAEEAERGRRAARTFPHTLVEVAGDRALTAWSELKERTNGAAIVLGGDGDLYRLADRMTWRRERGETPDGVLAAADRLRFPEDLFALRAAQDEKAEAYWRREREAGRPLPFDPDEPREWPPTGPWPDEVFEEESLAVATDWDFGDLEDKPQKEEATKPDAQEGARDVGRRVPLERVYIGLIPGADPTEAPAHLHWGGWNDVPSSEMLVVALRSWRDRYGAQLVGMSHDTWSLLVDRPPASREEALGLAREMVALCSDLLGEVKTLQGQAALAMENGWWNFWWD
jgi:hypothetical protein